MTGEAAEGREAPTVSVIMPVFNGAAFLPRSLPPLVRMRELGQVLEVLVVDDGSTDDTVSVALALGAEVVPSGGRTGVGAARNIGASRARGEILWFVDADVVVHDDAAGHLAPAFAEEGVVAVIGSYDDTPPARNFLSQYKNLVHHHYHQLGRRDASTFWGGCGAVNRAAFEQAGGFDAVRFHLPSVEDIELGYRLTAGAGRILLLPEMQGTHLKVWTLPGLLHTEIFRRAIPWTRLMLERGDVTNDLNVSSRERARAMLAPALVGLLVLAGGGWVPWWAVAACFAAIAWENRRLTALFASRNGVPFALAGLLFHQVYYLYSGAAFAWCLLEHAVRRPGSDPAS